MFWRTNRFPCRRGSSNYIDGVPQIQAVFNHPLSSLDKAKLVEAVKMFVEKAPRRNWRSSRQQPRRSLSTEPLAIKMVCRLTPKRAAAHMK